MRRLVLVMALTACTASGQATFAVDTTPVVVYQEPPPPQREVVEALHAMRTLSPADQRGPQDLNPSSTV